jgi:hypothetical protein
MTCPKCQSNTVSIIPAEVRLYRDGPRILGHPPVTPSPDIKICLDCGWSEFSVPRSWLSAGWLRSVPSASAVSESVLAASLVPAVSI